MRIPSRLVYAVIVAAGCGADARSGKDAAAPVDLAARDLGVHDLAPVPVDGCSPAVRCVAIVTGTDCSGTFCSLTSCPPGCEPFV